MFFLRCAFGFSPLHLAVWAGAAAASPSAPGSHGQPFAPEHPGMGQPRGSTLDSLTLVEQSLNLDAVASQMIGVELV